LMCRSEPSSSPSMISSRSRSEMSTDQLYRTTLRGRGTAESGCRSETPLALWEGWVQYPRLVGGSGDRPSVRGPAGALRWGGGCRGRRASALFTPSLLAFAFLTPAIFAGGLGVGGTRGRRCRGRRGGRVRTGSRGLGRPGVGLRRRSGGLAGSGGGTARAAVGLVEPAPFEHDADTAEDLAHRRPTGGALVQWLVLERLDDIEVVRTVVAAVFVGGHAR
jgi:hypothetical protein